MLKNWEKNRQKYIKNLTKSSEMLKNWKKTDKNILKS